MSVLAVGLKAWETKPSEWVRPSQKGILQNAEGMEVGQGGQLDSESGPARHLSARSVPHHHMHSATWGYGSATSLCDGHSRPQEMDVCS